MIIKLKSVKIFANNFSTKPFYHNEFNQNFKAILKDILKFFLQNVNFNNYTFERSFKTFQ